MKKIFEAELDRIRCEIPVVVVTRKELDKYVCDDLERGASGTFYPYNFLIYVNSRLPYYEKLWVLLHEYGHYLCWKNRCSCFFPLYQDKEETVAEMLVSEYHAHRYALKYLRKKGYKKSEKSCIDLIKWNRKSDEDDMKKAFRIVHKKAVKARLIKR